MDSMSCALYGLRPASRTTRYQAWDPKTELLHGDYADAVVAVVRSRTAVLRHWPNVGGWQHGFRWDHMVEDYRVPLLCFDQAREVTGKSGLYGRGVKVAARQGRAAHHGPSLVVPKGRRVAGFAVVARIWARRKHWSENRAVHGAIEHLVQQGIASVDDSGRALVYLIEPSSNVTLVALLDRSPAMLVNDAKLVRDYYEDDKKPQNNLKLSCLGWDAWLSTKEDLYHGDNLWYGYGGRVVSDVAADVERRLDERAERSPIVNKRRRDNQDNLARARAAKAARRGGHS